MQYVLECRRPVDDTAFWLNFNERLAAVAAGARVHAHFTSAHESSWPLVVATVLATRPWARVVLGFRTNHEKRRFVGAMRSYLQRVPGANVSAHTEARVHMISVRVGNVDSLALVASGATARKIDHLVTITVK